jgi:hypothetical protein
VLYTAARGATRKVGSKGALGIPAIETIMGSEQMSTSPIAAGTHTDLRPTKRWRRRLVRIGVVTLAVYSAALVGFDYAMHQPPEVFSRLMMRVGPAPFLLFPFESMWKSARAGHLRVGDTAPDFTLPLLDHSGSVTVSSFRGTKPVVLVFGSYT